jgi:hypothetical protein
MTIKKLVAGAKGAAGNSTGADIADAVNGLIDATALQSGTNLPVSLFPKDASFLVVTNGIAQTTLSYGVAPNGRVGIRVQSTVFCQINIPSSAGMRYQGDMYISLYGSRSISNLGPVEMRAYYTTTPLNYRVGKRISQSVTPENSTIEQGGALTFHFNAGNTTTVGTIPDPNNYEMASLRFTLQPANGDGNYYEAWIFGIGLGSTRKKGRICVMYDDGYESSYTLGFPIFNSIGVPQTMAVIATQVGKPGYMSLDQLRLWNGANGSCVAHGPIGGTGNLVSKYSAEAEWPQNAVNDILYNIDYLKTNNLAQEHDNQCYIWPEGAFQQSPNDTALLDAVSEKTDVVCARVASTLPLNNRQYIYNQDAVSKYQRLTMPRIGHRWAGSTAAEATNITNLVTMIQECALYGLDFYLVFHKIKSSNTPDVEMEGIDIRVSDMQTLANAVKAEIDAGRLEAVHMRDFVATNTVYGDI